MGSHGGGSEASSYDSDHYGDVARAGVSRMYVLTHSALSPLDQSVDYESERTADDDAKASSLNSQVTGARRRYGDLEAEHDGQDRIEQDRFQLLYMNGRHYFYGTVPLPEGLGDERDGKVSSEEDEEREITRRKRRDCHRPSAAGSITVEDLPLLLPHFQQHQDDLTCIDHVSHFRQELRDVIYQMEEVGEFMVEELSKGRIIQQVEQGSKEFHWMVSPQNPTFFELQTYPHTNESFEDAGVILIVLKIVVRGVLLDVIFHNDSYFIALRENADELAFEDTFVPNLSCIGPCYLVRRYSDEDLKQLLLWCSFPPESQLAVEGQSHTRASKASVKQFHLPAKTASKVLKVAPMRSNCLKSILEANDSQLYCILPTSTQTKSRHRTPARKREQLDEGQDEDDDDDQECSVVFQFNQYVYSGSSRLRHHAMNDLGRLSSYVLPSLKAQAFESLAFYGSLTDSADPTDLPVAIRWTAHVRRRFDEIAGTLVEIVNESQQWVERFLAEVDGAARDSASSPEKVTWLGSHLRGWLDNADGTEYFFELETSVTATQLWGVRIEEERQDMQSSDISLMLWKGIVNQVVVVVVYRRGSFYVVLRELKDVADLPRDGLEFFGMLPELDGKGRGYLVRNFPPAIGRRSQQWLNGAKLLLWQTMGSVAREDLAAENAQSKWLRSAAKQNEEKETSAWFEEKEEERSCRGWDDAVRHAIRVDNNGEKPSSSVSTVSPHHHQRDKSGRHHHLAPLNAGVRYATGAVRTAPWDIQTGRPV